MTELVLVGVDFSESSDEALRAAHDYAAATGAKLAVCHVVRELVGLNPLFPQHNQQSIIDSTELQSNLRQNVERRLAELTRSADVEVYVDTGVEYAEIVRRAEALQASLVVVGSHGRSGMARIFMGSVAERVVRYSPVSVLVARRAVEPGPVLVATDLSEPSLPAVAAGAEWAKRRGRELVVMHALDFGAASMTTTLGSPFGGIGVSPPIEAQQSIRQSAEGLLRDALTRFQAPGSARVVDGPTATSIVHTAEELGAELLVVGTHGRTGLKRLALGSVAERVIAAAPCSVLAVRVPS